MHTYIHIYMHTYIHTYMHTYIHTYIHAHIHTYMHTYFTDIRRNKHRMLRTALYWVVTQRVMVISYRCFGTTYRSHPQFQGGTNRLFRTSVRNYHYSLRHNPEECNCQLLPGGSLKSNLERSNTLSLSALQVP